MFVRGRELFGTGIYIYDFFLQVLNPDGAPEDQPLQAQAPRTHTELSIGDTERLSMQDSPKDGTAHTAGLSTLPQTSVHAVQPQ